MVLYKDDFEKELKANELARDIHFKGYEILCKVCEAFKTMVDEAEEKPKEIEENNRNLKLFG